MTWLALLGIVPLFIGFLVTLRARENDKRWAQTADLVDGYDEALAIQQLEADVDRPLSAVVRQAEMVAEEEWRQKTGEPMVTEFSDCINCGKNAIYMAGRRAPVSWVLTDPCRLHKPKP